MHLRSLFPLVVLVSRFVSIRGFVPLVNTRGISSSGFQMRLKKTMTDFDNTSSGLSLPIGSRRSKSKNMVPTYRPRSENQNNTFRIYKTMIFLLFSVLVLRDVVKLYLHVLLLSRV